MNNEERYKFLLLELVKHSDDIIEGLDAARCEGQLATNSYDEIKKLIEELKPFIDPKEEFRVGDLLNFPLVPNYYNTIKNAINNLIVILKVKVENDILVIDIAYKINISVKLISENDYKKFIDILENTVQYYLNKLRTSNLFRLERYQYGFTPQTSIPGIQYALDDAMNTLDVTKDITIKSLLEEKLLKPYIPYKGY